MACCSGQRQISKTSRSISGPTSRTDRKSTRLNSSHGYISYAVFCLKKKKKKRMKSLCADPRLSTLVTFLPVNTTHVCLPAEHEFYSPAPFCLYALPASSQPLYYDA